MFGIALAAVSDFFQEVSDSIGKYEVHRGIASAYSFGFLSFLFGTLFIFAEGLMRDNLVFSLASLPTFVPRLLLEVLQAHVTVRAITIADRADFGFVRTFTIPLLLTVDVLLGYAISVWQIAGMLIIALSVFALLWVEHGRVRGIWYLAIATVNAVATLSLYKYDITHFNSVEAEQSIVGLALIAYFFMLALWYERKNPLLLLKHRPLFVQSIASGLANVTASFAYFFAPASVVVTAIRSFAILFALISGRLYFRERHFIPKIFLFVLIAAGLVMLTRGA